MTRQDFSEECRSLMDKTPVILVIGAMLTSASLGQAQVYSWRDGSGLLVFSDTPTAMQALPPQTPPKSSPHRRQSISRFHGRLNAVEAIIQCEAARYAVGPQLVPSVIQIESAFDPDARSHEGTMGLTQLIPATGADLGVTDPFDPAQNIRGGVSYLRQQLDRFDGNEELALTAYTAAPEAVARYGNRVPPYQETTDYVREIRRSVHLHLPPHSTQVADGQTIYRSIQVIDRQRVHRYSDTPPKPHTPR